MPGDLPRRTCPRFKPRSKQSASAATMPTTPWPLGAGMSSLENEGMVGERGDVGQVNLHVRVVAVRCPNRLRRVRRVDVYIDDVVVPDHPANAVGIERSPRECTLHRA